ncbi:hypothetical protein JOE31_003562 [Arthrobacter sp. PvP023]|nr:hypothetical protein [Arthrobacter sp. PvP023]
MADGYEVFDSGHNKLVRRHQRLNAKQINEVMVALRLGSVEEARMVLLKGTGHRITLVTELYDVELHRIMAYIAKEKRKRLLQQHAPTRY